MDPVDPDRIRNTGDKNGKRLQRKATDISTIAVRTVVTSCVQNP